MAGFLLNPKVRHHFGRAASATSFFDTGVEQFLFSLERGGLEPPTGSAFTTAYPFIKGSAVGASPVFPFNFYRSIFTFTL